nr:hypothetical protein [Tanacetum cinerariifolium]
MLFPFGTTQLLLVKNEEVFWKMETLFSWEEIVEIQPLENYGAETMVISGQFVLSSEKRSSGDLVCDTTNVQRNTMELHVAKGDELINLEKSTTKAQTTFRVTWKFTKNSTNRRKKNVNDIEPVPLPANVNVQDPEPLPAKPSVNEHKRARDDNNEPEETLVDGETIAEDEEDNSTDEVIQMMMRITL